jgi:acetoin utilization protein AcuB
MTASPLPVEIDADIRTAEDLMLDHDVRHLPVLQDGVLVGVVSDRDIAGVWSVVNADPDKHIQVRSICSLDLYTVEVGEKLDHVLMEMAERRIGSAVVTQDEKIVGIFTATDACRCFGAFLRAHWPEEEGVSLE